MIAKSLKRKNIDLREDVFQALSVAAAVKGKNLKNFIEELLSSFADDYADEALYEYLKKHEPDGDAYLNSDEQKQFEKFLGL